MKITLGYWGIRGLGQPSRLLLHYTDAKWQDHLYTSQQQWFQKDKIQMGLPFPNIPYLIQGDLRITQSRAIMRYIVQRSDKKQLLGKTLKDQAEIDTLHQSFYQIWRTVVLLQFNADWEKQIGADWQKVKPKLDSLKAYIGEKDWALGYLTIIDFWISEFAWHLQKVFPKQYENYGFFERIRKNFEQLPEIKSYYQLATAIKGPYLPPTVNFK